MSKDLVTQKEHSLRSMLAAAEKSFNSLVPDNISVHRFFGVALTEFRRNPALHKCNVESVFHAIKTCAELGLECNRMLGQAYLVPFNGNVQLIAGYRGYITLARNSGEIAKIEATVVYSNDEFSYSKGLTPTLDHTPTLSKDKGEITHIYAVAFFHDKTVQFDVMTIEEVETIRDNHSISYKYAKNKGKNDSVWHKHFNEMAKKTVIKRLVKLLPLSVVRLHQAAAIENNFEDGKVTNIKNGVIDGEFTVVEKQSVKDKAEEETANVLGEFADAVTKDQEERDAEADAAQKEFEKNNGYDEETGELL